MTTWTLTFTTYTPDTYGSGAFGPNAFGDALIESNGNYYGIVLGTDSTTTVGPETVALTYADGATGHDGLVAGGLYQAPSLINYPNMYETADQVSGSGPRNNEPVWVNPNVLETVGPTQYSNELIGSPITDGFNVTEDACYAWNGISGTPLALNQCNPGDSNYGLWTVTDTFTAPSSFLQNSSYSIEVASYVCANGLIIASTPEPRALFLIVPVVLLLGWRFKRSRSAQLS